MHALLLLLPQSGGFMLGAIVNVALVVFTVKLYRHRKTLNQPNDERRP